MFTNPSATGFGVIIRNDKGEVMAASSARGAPASGSEEAEVLACCHAVEFAIFIVGDSATVMHNITDFGTFS